MSEIESSLGKKVFDSGKRKILAVTDDSDDFDTRPLPESRMPAEIKNTEVRLTPEEYNAMQAQRASLRTNAKKSSFESKQRVEFLTGIGRLSKEITIEGYKFTLRSLKSGEMREVIKVVSQVEIPSEQMYEMRAQTLARSIFMIDDMPVQAVLGASDLDGVVDYINDTEEHIVNKLYETYTDMVKSKNLVLDSAADAREVAEEIKK